jgi:hypothetical protein
MIVLHKPEGPGFMTRYTVQFNLPVDNPVNNVSMRKGKGFIEFQVPINHPDAHKMGFQDLLAAAELSGLFHISPTLKNTVASETKK